MTIAIIVFSILWTIGLISFSVCSVIFCCIEQAWGIFNSALLSLVVLVISSLGFYSVITSV